MAGSRTGTAEHKRWRAQVLRQGQLDGITHCPRCRVFLDYDITLRPNSAEPDHIIPWSKGGRNTPENGTVICRLCNQQMNAKTGRRPKQKVPTIDFET
ncbi:HNH endonuclease [Glutamicibacter creatinolyticus]|uniref:HNH endonuclease n=1 Tax=Glutamicibacter creatinolyticus TaxID=162496 RepID=UPI003CD0AC36